MRGIGRRIRVQGRTPAKNNKNKKELGYGSSDRAPA
jgi:hypothetical protein